MADESLSPDLLDLKFLPAWVRESPNDKGYADFIGEEPNRGPERDRRAPEQRPRGPRPARRAPRRDFRSDRPQMSSRPPRPEPPVAPLPAMDIRFLPDPRALEGVLAQIKAGHVAYSAFFLARMFLEKPERYDVRLESESGTFFQLGENGPVALDRRLLENSAFAREKENFYRVETIQLEPIKGNFTSVARCRLSGVLLGPTNYHGYQTQLRQVYEQRFSRRMSFPDYQRQIEIVTDPAVVESWKEEARTRTTYTTLNEESPITFSSLGEAERHFRQAYLPGIIRQSNAFTLDGVASRSLAERALGKAIEEAWSREIRSPSRMMQELINAFRGALLHVFRHRKGALFVSPIRPRTLSYDKAAVSPSVDRILRAIGQAPGISRKRLLEQVAPAEETGAASERQRYVSASDLRWLVSEGHVIEFNDGSLDLPRSKPNQNAGSEPASSSRAVQAETADSEKSFPAEEHAAAAEAESGSDLPAAAPENERVISDRS